jgi:hypothetical protein
MLNFMRADEKLKTVVIEEPCSYVGSELYTYSAL